MAHSWGGNKYGGTCSKCGCKRVTEKKSGGFRTKYGVPYAGPKGGTAWQSSAPGCASVMRNNPRARVTRKVSSAAEFKRYLHATPSSKIGQVRNPEGWHPIGRVWKGPHGHLRSTVPNPRGVDYCKVEHLVGGRWVPVAEYLSKQEAKEILRDYRRSDPSGDYQISHDRLTRNPRRKATKRKRNPDGGGVYTIGPVPSARYNPRRSSRIHWEKWGVLHPSAIDGTGPVYRYGISKSVSRGKPSFQVERFSMGTRQLLKWLGAPSTLSAAKALAESDARK